MELTNAIIYAVREGVAFEQPRRATMEGMLLTE